MRRDREEASYTGKDVQSQSLIGSEAANGGLSPPRASQRGSSLSGGAVLRRAEAASCCDRPGLNPLE